MVIKYTIHLLYLQTRLTTSIVDIISSYHCLLQKINLTLYVRHFFEGLFYSLCYTMVKWKGFVPFRTGGQDVKTAKIVVVKITCKINIIAKLLLMCRSKFVCAPISTTVCRHNMQTLTLYPIRNPFKPSTSSAHPCLYLAALDVIKVLFSQHFLFSRTPYFQVLCSLQ